MECGIGQLTGLDEGQDMVLPKPYDGVTQALGPRQVGTAMFRVVSFPEDSLFAAKPDSHSPGDSCS